MFIYAIINDMNINISIDSNMNTDDIPPHPMPPGPVCRRPWHDVGWGDINIYIDIYIDVHIMIDNMCVYNPLASHSRRRPQALFLGKKHTPFSTMSVWVAHL